MCTLILVTYAIVEQLNKRERKEEILGGQTKILERERGKDCGKRTEID